MSDNPSPSTDQSQQKDYNYFCNAYYNFCMEKANCTMILASTLCILGFGLLFIAAIVAVCCGYETAAVPAAGGIVTVLLAIIALYAFRASQKRLDDSCKAFFKTLHEDEEAERMVELAKELDEADKKEMLKKIIQSSLKLNASDSGS